MDDSWVVYGLRLRGTYEYRYVGLTTYGARKRLRSHKKSARQGRKLPVNDWLRKDFNLVNVVIDVLEHFPDRDFKLLNFREQFWIAALKESGHRLLNLTDGGDGVRGFSPSLETRKLMSEKAKGRKGPWAGVTGKDHPSFGNKHSDETKKKWSEQRKGSISGSKNPNYGKFGKDHPAYGRKYSPETLKRLSEAKLGEKNPNYGKPHTEEWKRKISEASKGKPRPSSRRSAHVRYHVNKPGYSDKCSFCLEEYGASRPT